jgi:hypothetical protein
VASGQSGSLTAGTELAGNFCGVLFVLEISRTSNQSYLNPEDAMRAYLAHLTPKALMLLAVPVVAIAYPVVTVVVPAVVRAVVPEVVRSVLSLL